MIYFCTQLECTLTLGVQFSYIWSQMTFFELTGKQWLQLDMNIVIESHSVYTCIYVYVVHSMQSTCDIFIVELVKV